jgi:hypothetical protein
MGIFSIPSYFFEISKELRKILKKCKNDKIHRLTCLVQSAKMNWRKKWRRRGGIADVHALFCFMGYF